MGLITDHSPLEISYTDALRQLGMFRGDLTGDEQYEDTRIDRIAVDHGTSPDDAFALKKFQVIGT